MCFAIVFAQSIEAWCLVENEDDVVGAAPAGDASTTFEWPTVLYRPEVRKLLLFYFYFFSTWS